jgi:hypothetical protein
MPTLPEILKNASNIETASVEDRRSATTQEQALRDQIRATFYIVDILEIPAAENDAARKELLEAIRQCADLFMYGPFTANLKSFTRIKSLCKDLLEEFRRLNGSGRRFLGDDYYDDESFEFFRNAIWKLGARANLFKLGRRPANRPNGSIKNPIVQSIIFEMYRIVQKHGGKLTLGMNINTHKPNGSLPAVLAVLHVLWPDTIPRKFPYQTLRRMRRHAVDEFSRLSAQGGPPSPDQVRSESR